jgi:hypothetical protein
MTTASPRYPTVVPLSSTVAVQGGIPGFPGYDTVEKQEKRIMKALLYSSTDTLDYTLQLPVITAVGEEPDSQAVVEAFSDDLSLLEENWEKCTFHLWGVPDKSEVGGDEISFAEVVDAFLHGDCNELSVDVPDTTTGYHTENWALRDIPEAVPEEKKTEQFNVHVVSTTPGINASIWLAVRVPAGNRPVYNFVEEGSVLWEAAIARARELCPSLKSCFCEEWN